LTIDELLASKDLLFRIGKSFPTVVNEADNILYGDLVILAKQSIEIRGGSSGGKNAVGSAIQESYPEGWIKDFTGLTTKALRHLPDHIRGVYIREKRALKTGGADEESDAEFDVKMAISEGFLKIWIPKKDPMSDTGWTTVEKKIKVDSFILTTTAEAAAEEYENRLHLTRIRDDAGQSQRVVEFILEQAEKPTWDKVTQDGADTEVVRGVFAAAENAPPTVIPYAKILVDAFSFDRTAVRRNVPKLLGLIAASARIHHKQRVSITGPNGEVNLVAYPEDLYMVLSIGRKALVQTLDFMSPPIAETLNVCVILAKESVDITVRSVMDRLRSEGVRVAHPTVYKRLKTLEERGYLARRDDRDRNNALVLDVVGQKAESPLSTLNTNEKRLEIERRFRSWLEAVGKTTEVSEARTYVDPIEGTERPVLSIEESVVRARAEQESRHLKQDQDVAFVSDATERGPWQ
jgi:hypothetical protein